MSNRLRRLAVAAGAAGIATLLAAAPGLAWVDWCESDPPVHVVTAAGHSVTINNFLGSTIANRHLLRQAILFGYAEPAGAGTSRIHVFVILPRGGSAYVHVRSQASRYATVIESNGAWGDLIELQLSVPID